MKAKWLLSIVIIVATVGGLAAWAGDTRVTRNPARHARGVLYPDKIADLRAATPPSGQQARAFVAGYHRPGDGGGGEFVWDDASVDGDNGGTVIRPTGNPPAGRWRRALNASSPLSVKWFGAVGDRVTDDTCAVKNAIKAAIAMGLTGIEGFPPPGVVVFFPPGIYRIEETLNIAALAAAPPRPVNLMGDSRSTSVLLFAVQPQEDGVVFDFPNSSTGTTIANLTLTGDNEFSSNVRDLLSIRGCGVLIEDCELRYCSRYNLFVRSTVNLVARSTNFFRAGTSNVFIGNPDNLPAGDSTTATFYNCYANITRDGPGFDVNCAWASFYSCIAEGIGWWSVPNPNPVNAYGIRVRGGQCNIYSFYGEANGNHDIYVGSHGTRFPDGRLFNATAVITSPTFYGGHPHQLATKAGIYMDHTTGGCILGSGYTPNLAHSVVFTQNSSGCALLGVTAYPGSGNPKPEYVKCTQPATMPCDPPGENRSIHNYPGLVTFPEAYADNYTIMTGKMGHIFGGDTDVVNHNPTGLNKFLAFDPSSTHDNWIATVPPNGSVTTTRPVEGARTRQTAIASLTNPPSELFSIYAYVSSDGAATLVFTNLSAQQISLNSNVTVTVFEPGYVGPP